MKILSRYIVKTIFLSILFVAVAWVIIFSLFDFLADSKNIGVGDYSLLDSIYVLILNAPLLIYKRLIVIMLIGVILALGSLASTSQIIIARSVGMSIFGIARIVIFFTTFLYLIIASFGELVAPKLTEYSIEYKALKTGKTEVKLLSQQVWIKDKNLIVNMEKNYDGKNFAGINIFSIKDNKLQQLSLADRMHIEKNQATLGNSQNYEILENSLNFTTTSNQKLNLLFDEKLIETLEKDPLDLSIVNIYKQVSFLNDNGLKSGIFQIELYKRMIKPFILITTILFSMLFIFGSMRNSTMGKKLFLGIAISLILELYLRISGALVLKFDYNYALVVLMPIVIFFIITLKLLSTKK
jgi:lipopolysaccharide export system permease protein